MTGCEAEKEENYEVNSYRGTLASSKTLVGTCGDKVYSGLGSPLDAIANPISQGGWVCTEATNWVADMKGACTGIPEAFDSAVATIQERWVNEPCHVAEDDYRGNSWNRSWANERRLR